MFTFFPVTRSLVLSPVRVIRSIRCSVFTLLLLCPFTAMAQESVEADVQVDLTSKSLWRGQTLGGPAVQPSAEVRWQGLYVAADASTGFDAADRERIGLQIGYRAPFGLNVGFGSQWMSGIDEMDRYFHFDEHTTGHRFEANLGYTCRYFSLQAYTILMGNDFNEFGDDRKFSTFVELAVPFRMAGIDWQARAAVTPFESSSWREVMLYNGNYEKMLQYLYADGFTCVEAALRATKDFHVAGYSLPVYVELNANPYTEKAAVMAGITLRPFQKRGKECSGQCKH